MIGIMREFHKYVPMMGYEKDVYVPSINKSVQVVAGSAHMIQFVGDQRQLHVQEGHSWPKCMLLLIQED